MPHVGQLDPGGTEKMDFCGPQGLKPTAMPYGFMDRKGLLFVSGSVLREMVKPYSREKRREQGFFPVV